MILSIDGGGIRGAIPARIMQRLDNDVPGWRDRVTIRMGTSTGGLLALGLASGMSPADMVEVYRRDGEAIFTDSVWDDIADVDCIFGAKYGLDGLAATLKRIFGNRCLRDLSTVAVTAVDLDRRAKEGRSWAAKVFHNVPGADDADLDVEAWKAGMYTAAAPLYFPDCDGYVDGGLWAGNPALAALALAVDERNTDPVAVDAVAILSLGTGKANGWKEGVNKDRGLADWGTDIISCILATSGDSVDYIANRIIADRYHRCQYTMPVAWGMDDWEAVPAMIEWVDTLDLGPTARWIESH